VCLLPLLTTRVEENGEWGTHLALTRLPRTTRAGEILEGRSMMSFTLYN